MLARVAGALIGRTLHDSYRITRLVGVGGMGVVYEAVHVRLAKKRFAVKVLLPELLEMPDVYARFRREAEVVTEIGHPHIVEVLDFNWTDDGLPYMVMEFLEGEDLGKRIQRCGRLRPAEVIQVMLQVGGAIQAAHDHGVVHRDLKPDNIFLLGQPGDQIQAKVLDFGISKIRHQGQSMVTQENCIIGTPGFMSPEQAEGLAKDVDHTTDIFALGAICYYALGGQIPFDATSVPAVLYKVCHADPPDLTVLVGDLSPAVDAVLRRAMAKAKADRYQRVETFVQELCRVLARPAANLLRRMASRSASDSRLMDELAAGLLPIVPLDSAPTLVDAPPTELEALAPVHAVEAPAPVHAAEAPAPAPAPAPDPVIEPRAPLAPSFTHTTLSAAAGEETKLPVHPGRWGLLLGGIGLVLLVAVGGTLMTVRDLSTQHDQEQPVAGARPADLAAPDAAVGTGPDQAAGPARHDGAVPDASPASARPAARPGRRSRARTGQRTRARPARGPMFDDLDAPSASKRRGKRKKLIFDEL